MSGLCIHISQEVSEVFPKIIHQNKTFLPFLLVTILLKNKKILLLLWKNVSFLLVVVALLVCDFWTLFFYLLNVSNGMLC